MTAPTRCAGSGTLVVPEPGNPGYWIEVTPAGDIVGPHWAELCCLRRDAQRQAREAISEG